MGNCGICAVFSENWRTGTPEIRRSNDRNSGGKYVAKIEKQLSTAAAQPAELGHRSEPQEQRAQRTAAQLFSTDHTSRKTKPPQFLHAHGPITFCSRLTLVFLVVLVAPYSSSRTCSSWSRSR